MATALLIVGVVVLAAGLMFFRLLPALLALPLMAVGITVVEIAAGNLTWGDLASTVLADGATRLAEPMVIALFGGMLGSLLEKGGVASSLVRKGAELAGDNPWVVAMVMLALIALLFTTIGGLGAVVMVGTIVLPILASLGLREHVTAGVLLIGISLGGLLNAGNWVVYRTVLGLESETVYGFALLLVVITGAGATAFVTLELVRARMIRLRSRGILLAFAAAAVLVLLLWHWPAVSVDTGALVKTLRMATALAGAVLLAAVIVDRLRARRSGTDRAVRWYAYLMPLVPLVLIIVFEVPFLAAFVAGLAFGVLALLRRGIVNLTMRAMIEGSAAVVPALLLMVGIGMVLNAILGSGEPSWPVLTDMRPLLETVVPTTPVAYVGTFAVLAPLALYRGPFNVWGLGYGVAGILLAAGLPAGAAMGALMSLGMVQGISDPTNTANVWVANEVGLDVNVILARTIAYSWAIALAGLLVAAWQFML
jgi:hypothetical protein